MTVMKTSDPCVTAIDLGSSHCTTVIAVPNPEGSDYRIVGFASLPARGIKKGNIVDLDQAVQTIMTSLDRAEKMAGLQSRSAVMSVTGSHITSQNLPGMIAISNPNQEVTAEDVARVIDAAKAVALPAGREIIFLAPRFFTLDSQEGIKDPLGMVGMQLRSEVHMITGGTANIRNLEKCMKDLELGIDDFVFEGLAAAEVTLTDTERELGVVAINMGAGTTSFCAYVDGSIAYSGCLPIGANHITQDIALAYKISFDSAEKIKLSLSEEDLLVDMQNKDESKEEYRRRLRLADALDPALLGIPETIGSISKNYLIRTVMMARVREIFELVVEQLESRKLKEQIPSGAVISGGGALTVGITDEATKILGLNARVGAPNNVRGVAENLEDPRFATVLGLLQYITHQQSSSLVSEAPPQIISSRGNLLNKISDFFRSFFP